MENLGLGRLALDCDTLGPTLYEYRKTAAIIIVTLLILYQLLFVYREDRREPQLIKPWFPLIGHAINIYRHGSRHFVVIA